MLKKIAIVSIFFIATYANCFAANEWIQKSGLSNYSDGYYSASSTNPWLYFINTDVQTGALVTGPIFELYICENQICEYIPPDIEDGDSASASAYYLTDRNSTSNPESFATSSDWFSAGYINGGSNTIYADAIQRSENFCNYSTFTCPTTVYHALYLKPKATDTDPTTYIPLGYWKLHLDSGSFGASPVYSIVDAPGGFGGEFTHIQNYSPGLNATTTTLTTVSATGYVDGILYGSVQIKFSNIDTLTAYEYTATSTGSFSIAKQFALDDGLHQGNICLAPNAGFSGVICKPLSFTVGQSGLVSPYQPIETTFEFCENIFPQNNTSDITAILTFLPNSLCNMGYFLIVPNQQAISQFTNIHLETKAPFSYVYDINNIRQELFAATASGSGEISYEFGSYGTMTLISHDLVDDFPLSSVIKTILAAFIYFFMAEYIYRRGVKIFN